MTEFTNIIEDAATNFAAYAPDVPGCVAAADTEEEVTALFREAIAQHLELLREMGRGDLGPQFSLRSYPGSLIGRRVLPKMCDQRVEILE